MVDIGNSTVIYLKIFNQCAYKVRLAKQDMSDIKKVVKDFWDVHCSCVSVESRVVDSVMNGFSCFSGDLFAILVY